MTGIAPNQIFSASFPVTAGSTVNTQISDLAAGTVGKINFLNINFTGHAAIVVANGMSFNIQDAGLTGFIAQVRANRANAAALDIPGVNLFNLNNMNIPFSNGLTGQAISTIAGDSGTFTITLGYDRTF